MGRVRPSGYLGWASSGATNVTEPTDAKKALGWSVNESGRSSYFNWILQKQDEWIQYLKWKSEFDTIFDTDFNDAPHPHMWYSDGTVITGSKAGETHYQPLWLKSATGAYGGFGAVTVGLYPDGGGANGSYLAYISNQAPVPQPDQDFFLETLCNFLPDGGGTPSTLNTAYVGFGPTTGPLSFMATGNSGYWGLRIKQSGNTGVFGITSIGLSVTQPPSGYSYNRFAVECRGPTMCVFVNQQQVYALKRPVFALFGGAELQNFGINVRNYANNFACGVAVDRLTYKVRRGDRGISVT